MHCPTKRQGTWQTLPLILPLCRWLLPSFSSCSWFLLVLGSVHQEAFNSLKRVGRRGQQGEAGPILHTIPGGYSAAEARKPFLSLFAEYEHAPYYNFKNRSAPPPDNWGVFGPNGCQKLQRCPNLAYCTPLTRSLFTLVSSGKHCTNAKKREDCDLFGSSVRAAGNLPSVVPLCNQATLSLPNYWDSQIFTESRGKNRAPC